MTSLAVAMSPHLTADPGQRPMPPRAAGMPKIAAERRPMTASRRRPVGAEQSALPDLRPSAGVDAYRASSRWLLAPLSLFPARQRPTRGRARGPPPNPPTTAAVGGQAP